MEIIRGSISPILSARDPLSPPNGQGGAEEAVIDEIMKKIGRRDKPTRDLKGSEIHGPLATFHDRLDSDEAVMRSHSRAVYLSVVLSVVCLVVTAMMFVSWTNMERPSAEDADRVLERNMKQPIERLEGAINRLENRLPR